MRWALHEQPVGGEEDDVVGSAPVRFAQRRHVDGVGLGLRAEQQPGRALPRAAVEAPVERHDTHTLGARPRVIGDRIRGDPRARGTGAAATQGKPHRRLAGWALRACAVDRGAPLGEVGTREVADDGGLVEPREMRLEILRMAVHDADRLEDGIAPEHAVIVERQGRRPGWHLD